MSSPSEPVDTVSTSMALEFLPSFMIEPLPKARSICDSAASSALDLSIEAPSITRRAAGAIVALLMAGIRGTDKRVPPRHGTPGDEELMYTICSQFAICSHTRHCFYNSRRYAICVRISQAQFTRKSCDSTGASRQEPTELDSVEGTGTCVKRHKRMATPADYRLKAAEFIAKAQQEPAETTRIAYRLLA